MNALDADSRCAVDGQALLLIPSILIGNMYVRLLGQAYQKAGVDVIFGPENLIESTCRFDAIHLQWPEEQYRGPGSGALETKASRFLQKLDLHKRRGGKLIWTVHNIAPHEYGGLAFDHRVYQEVIDRCDLIVHHCPRSVEMLAAAYDVPELTSSIVVPFPTYDGYADTITRQEARARLDISDDAYVYLCFGAIRGYKGFDTLLDAFRRARTKKKFLLVAGRYTGKGGWKGKLDSLRLTLMDRFDRNVRMHLKMVDDDDVQLYLRAADAVVLTNRRGLNSGVAVLAMSFGKIVIGPDIGCIGNALRQGKNLIYRAGDVIELVNAMERAPALDAAEAQTTNARVAASWAWSDLVGSVLERIGDLRSVSE